MKKGRITTTVERNYKLFVEQICKSQVPVILVVTGCDFAKEKQWAMENQKGFEKNGMEFKEYLSVCAKKEGWDAEEVNINLRI
jgi:GTPase Era involved in 16S rRNA processing